MFSTIEGLSRASRAAWWGIGYLMAIFLFKFVDPFLAQVTTLLVVTVMVIWMMLEKEPRE